jgi:hypothetical protein
MSFTYNPSNAAPGSGDDISAVRFALGDTDPDTNDDGLPAVSDEEITAWLSSAPVSTETSATIRVLVVAHQIARALARKYRRQPSFSTRELSMQMKERAEAWDATVEDLRCQLVNAQNAAQVAAGNTELEQGIITAGRASSFDGGSST